MWIFLVLSSITLAKEANSKKELAYFITLADIHFDPFIYCEDKKPCPLIEKLRQSEVSQWRSILASTNTFMSHYRQDTNYALLTSSLNAAKKIAEIDKIKFVLVLGDLLGHEYYHNYKAYSSDKTRAGYHAFVRKTLAFLNQALMQAFPQANIYMVVGNNDSYQGDYRSDPGGAFFKDSAETFKQSLNINDQASFKRQFSLAGYYALDIPNIPDLKLIVLNSNLFSDQAKGRGVPKAAEQELDWLQGELAKAKANGQKVLIAMHIPLGIDVYQTIKFRLFKLVEFWNPLYSKRFQTEIERYTPEIIGIFTGHLHADSFRIITQGPNGVPATSTPSISPIFGSNPGFKVYAYSESARRLVDFVTYYTILNGDGTWEGEYHLNRIYHPNCFTCPPVGKKLNSKEWQPYYWCPIHQITTEDYKICVN